MTIRPFRNPLACSALALMLAGCTVGPDYAAPETQVQDAWVEQADTGAIDPAWWQAFGDPQLTALIERSLAESPTLAEARARLTQARANRDAVQGQRLPQVSASGAATENRLSENGQLPVSSIPGFSPDYSLFDLGFDASWEIDLWGRRTREAQAADAQAGAAEAQYQGALVQLTAEIARSYMDLRAAQQSSALARQATNTASEISALTSQLYEAGEANRQQANAASAEAGSARDAAAQAESAEAAAIYRLAALAGQKPEDIAPSLRESAPVPDAPENILVGVRSDLLRRRPDVRAAERQLAAATAQIGVATADLFPRFSLMGGLGTQARDAGDLFDPASTRFSIGPTFSWPIFAGGSIRARIRAADAASDAAAAVYEQTVIEALNDSEAAINRFARAKQREAAATAAAADQERAYALAMQRFDAGEDDRLTLDQARLELLSRTRAAVLAKAEAAQAAVALYKALGGVLDDPDKAGAKSGAD